MDSLLSKLEDFTDNILRHSKNYLPHLARLCLISTFIEDAIRMWFQWSDQASYVEVTWHCGAILANVFVLWNMVAQAAGCLMVLIRKKVFVAVGVLFAVIVIQTVVYSVLWDARFFLRNLALFGALLLLLAESSEEAKTMFAGIPSTGINQTKNYMQLAGRLLVIFMFLTLFKFDMSILQIIGLIVGAVFMTGVALGYKAKVCALILMLWLTCLNFIMNPWWSESSSIMRDFYKYDFFQTLSVVGGLLLIVALGPGGVSWDDYKKQW